MYRELPKQMLKLWSESDYDENGSKSDDDKILSLQEKLRAAYALNLCTVSVSQIVKDRDQYIMDQEYDAILNNLNLQNIPNDESLLKILKEILDVITFFRIQEGDRAFIEEDYKQALRQNLTSAVNVAGLIGSMTSIGINDLMSPAAWVKTGVTVATTVGVGYMNYRSGKNQARLNKKKKEWELQRSAIEQLNGLRRELFDTAWHITKNFQIDDSYRLTENQIAQYLDVLRDPDDFRRLERLDFIKDKFYAYPPFWYQLGHTARLVAIGEAKNKENYEEFARACFEFFVYMTEANILRDDQIASSCALEYIELLDPEKEKNKIRDLLSKALEYSGNRNDVVELCAIGYLRIGELEKASRLLWRLVNEKYDENFNAEMLSIVYCKLYTGLISSDNDLKKAVLDLSAGAKESLFPSASLGTTEEGMKRSIEYAYDLLRERVSENAYIIPLPEEGKVITEKGYLKRRANLLKIKSDEVEKQLYKIFSKDFAHIIIPESMVDDWDGLDETVDVKKWIDNKFECIISGKNCQDYLRELKNEPILIKVFYAYENIYNRLSKFVDDSIEIKDQIQDEINEYLRETSEGYKAIEDVLLSTEGTSGFDIIQKNSNLFVIQNLLERIAPIIQVYNINKINDASSLDEIGELEQKLYLFSKEFNIIVPVIPNVESYNTDQTDTRKEQRAVDPSILGLDDIEEYEAKKKAEKERFNILVSIFEKKRDQIIINPDKYSFRIYGGENYEQFIKGRPEFNNTIPVAVISQDKELFGIKEKKSLAFTTEGIYWLETGISVPYREIEFSTKNILILHNKKYDNACIDFDSLRALIEEIIPIADKTIEIDSRKFIDEKKVEEKANIIVKKFTTMAAMNGSIPIPMVNVVPALSIQITMMYSISKAFMLDLTKEELKELSSRVIVESCKNTGAQQVLKAVALLVPGGVVVNSVASASATGALTYAMGMSFITYCKQLLKDQKERSISEKSEFRVEDAANKMKESFEQLIVKKEEEITVVREKEIEFDTRLIEETRNDLNETATVIKKTAEYIVNVEKQIESDHNATKESMRNGWNELKKRYKKESVEDK